MPSLLTFTIFSNSQLTCLQTDDALTSLECLISEVSFVLCGWFRSTCWSFEVVALGFCTQLDDAVKNVPHVLILKEVVCREYACLWYSIELTGSKKHLDVVHLRKKTSFYSDWMLPRIFSRYLQVNQKRILVQFVKEILKDLLIEVRQSKTVKLVVSGFDSVKN
mgnify:CR=1 FL=1